MAAAAAGPEHLGTALLYAAGRGDTARVAQLLDQGAAVESKHGVSDRLQAAANSATSGWRVGARWPAVPRASMPRALRTAASSQNGMTAAIWAAQRGHADTAAILLDRGADIEGKSYVSRAAESAQQPPAQEPSACQQERQSAWGARVCVSCAWSTDRAARRICFADRDAVRTDGPYLGC